MKHFYHAFTMLLITGLLFSQVRAQEAIPVTGGDATGTGGMVNYTIGQIFYQQQDGNDENIIEGVQQPYEISVLSVEPEAKAIELSFGVYPNPVFDFLRLSTSHFDDTPMYYRLYDLKGLLLEEKQVTGMETMINMRTLVAQTYILKVYTVDREIKTFKIIKN